VSALLGDDGTGRYTDILNRGVEPLEEELLHILARRVPRELNGNLETRLA
jgi:hypothetical protein